VNRQPRTPRVRTFWQWALAIIAIVAIVQELSKPRDERTWHGKVFDLVPYDFRAPTIERVRSTYWNPGGPFLSARVFGVGWAPNFAAMKRLFGH
jgi:hypothetical protein